MVDFIAGSIKFISKYLMQIILTILILLLITVYLTVRNVHFAKSHPTLQRVVEIEGFLSETDRDLGLHLCKHNQSEADAGEANCNKLGYASCNLTECCGWAKGKDDFEDKCVAVRVRNGRPLGMIHRNNVDRTHSLHFQNEEINI